ncbi:unnamed protein product, partial [Brassica napus]
EKTLLIDIFHNNKGLKPTLPAYLNPSVKPVDLLTGVSFASTEGGLDDGTAMMSLTLTMDKQWSYFEEAVRKMKSLVGDSETNRVIKNALFVISAGTNDMIYNVYDHVLGRFISVSDYQDYTQQNRSVYPGLEETLVGCCGTGLLEAGPLCKPLSRTCEDVSKYMFFDSVHPSQKAYSVIATYAFKKLFPLL